MLTFPNVDSNTPTLLLAVSSPSILPELKALNVRCRRNQTLKIAILTAPYPNGRYAPETSHSPGVILSGWK